MVYAACAAACSSALSGPVRADEFPSRPVSIYVANAPGSQADLLGRILAQGMAARLGQSVIVENRVGASGFIAARATAQAAADGYTVMLGSSGVMAINPHVYASVPYDARKDFAAVAYVASSPSVFLVSAETPAGNLRDFTASAAKAGRPINFGSLGTGATTNIVSQLFGHAASLPVTEIAYKSEPAIVNDLVAGRLDFSILPIASTITYIRSGKLKALAVTSLNPTTLLPGVPALSKTFPGFAIDTWWGLVAPAGTPKPVLDKLSRAFADALAAPETKTRFETLMAEPVSSTPAEFDRFMAAERAKYQAIVKASGAKVD